MARLKFIIVALLCIYPSVSTATKFILPENGDDVIGQPNTVTANDNETLLDIGRRHGLGYQDITLANPGVDVWLPGKDTSVTLSTQFILPHTPHTGIVLNIPEMRLYYYPEHADLNQTEVITYPLRIGREG